MEEEVKEDDKREEKENAKKEKEEQEKQVHKGKEEKKGRGKGEVMIYKSKTYQCHHGTKNAQVRPKTLKTTSKIPAVYLIHISS